MVNCTCGKPLDKVPAWLEGIKVEFICNNCPNRQTKNIAFISLDTGVKSEAKSIDDDLGPIEDEDEE
jgi:hypothetical protein